MDWPRYRAEARFQEYAEMENRGTLSAAMVELDGKLYSDPEVVVLLQSSLAKWSAAALCLAIKSEVPAN